MFEGDPARSLSLIFFVEMVSVGVHLHLHGIPKDRLGAVGRPTVAPSHEGGRHLRSGQVSRSSGQ